MNRKSDSPQNQRLKVFARCRPLDVALGDAAMMEVLPEENKLVLKDRKTLKEYIFDQVFSADSKQNENISKFRENAFKLYSAYNHLGKWSIFIDSTEREALIFKRTFEDVKPQEIFQKTKSDLSQWLTNTKHSLRDSFKDLQKSHIDKYERVSTKIGSCNSEPLEDNQIKTCIENVIALISNKIDDEPLDDKFADILAHLGVVFAESEKGYSDSAAKLQNAILEMDSDMEKFISESFVKDISTGTTPQQRNRYSRSTSPNRNFIHSFQYRNRMEVHLEENDESICSDVSSFLNSQDISFESNVHCQISDICQPDSATQPETHFEDADKECNKENKLPGLPKGIAVESFLPITMNCEQQFKTSPLGSHNKSKFEVGRT